MKKDFKEWLKAKGKEEDKLTAEEKVALEAEFEAEMTAEAIVPDPKKDAEDPAKKAVADMRAAAVGEAERIADMADLFDTYGEQIEKKELRKIKAEAIEDGWDLTKTELNLLRAARPKAPAIQSSQEEGGSEVIEAALCMGRMKEESIVKAYGEKTVEAAQKKYRGVMSIQEVLLACAGSACSHIRRIRTNSDVREVLQAAFSTQNATGILSNVANKVLLDSFLAVDKSWREVAVTAPVSDFKSVTHYRLTGDAEYEEVGTGGDIPHMKTNEETYSAQAKTYGKMFVITRQDIINDDLGAFDQIRSMLGRGAALKLNSLFWTAFLDNSTFFTGARGNYTSGAATNLSSAALTTLVTLFRKLKDADGKYIGLTPRILLVPPDLEAIADELYASRNINTGGAATTEKVPNANTHAGKYRPVVSPYLSDTGITGYSITAWYLLADPRDLAVAKVVFLNGQETPTVESAEADFNTLGIQLRGYYDVGVALADYYAGVKSKGAA